MSVNFGQFDGYKIQAEAGSRAVDRLVNAVQEKKRQEEEAARLAEQQRQYNERLEFDKSKQKDLTDYQDKTLGLEEENLTLKKTIHKDEMKYKYDLKDENSRQFYAKLGLDESMHLDRMMLDYDRLGQDWDKFKDTMGLEYEKLGFDISKWDDQKIIDFRNFAENQRQFNKKAAQTDTSLAQGQQKIDIDEDLAESKIKTDEQNRVVTAYNLERVKKQDRKTDTREDNVALFSDIMSSLPKVNGESTEAGVLPSLLDIAYYSDAQLNDMIIQAGGKALDEQGLNTIRKNIEEQKVRNLSADEFSMVGDDGFRRQVYAVEGEVPSDLEERMKKKTGAYGGSNAYDVNDPINDDVTSLLNTAAGQRFQNDVTLSGNTELSFSKPGKRPVNNEKDGALLKAWKTELTKIARDNPDLDDMDIRANKDGTYTLTEWDPVVDDKIKIKIDDRSGKPMFLDPESGQYILLGDNLDTFLDELK